MVLRNSLKIAIIVGSAFAASLVQAAAPGRTVDTGNVDVLSATKLCRDFVRAFAEDALDEICYRLILEREPEVSSEKYGIQLKWLGKTSGKLYTFHLGSPDRSLRHNIGPDDARLLATAFMKVLNPDNDFSVRSLVDNKLSYYAVIVPRASGVDFSDLCSMSLEMDKKGYPRFAYLTDVYTTRGSSKPDCTPVEAEANARNAFATFAPYARSVIDTPKLVWCPPAFAKLRNEMTSKHVDAANARVAILLYSIKFWDEASWSSEEKDYLSGSTAFVDAETGRTVAFWTMDFRNVMKNGSRSNVPMSWSGFDKNVNVCGVKEQAMGSIAPVAEQKSREKGVPVQLISRNRLVRADFDPKTGLLWMEQDGKRLYGKPNAALLKALKSVKPVKVKPFGQKAASKKG